MLSFSGREVRDLLVAWLALGVAFALFFAGGGQVVGGLLLAGEYGALVSILVVSLLTAGVGFLLHELGHKVVAVRFGQRAAFRADYGMLFLAVASALAGFLFAAPGAVHHAGRITEREHGLIALAGPAVNVALAGLFLPVAVAGVAVDSSLVTLLGERGLAVNLLLAAFNMLPFGPLDGNTVRGWSTPVWLVGFLLTAGLAVGVFVLRIGL
ncbi:peptidase M50 [Candidatus Halobonum tyrrellensis]|uniref:Peptidase M50 n=1 Tax=Candidatus Halobonum tyrrellensis G22 TaxID=1324957 RepID=V4HF20_9EURY|nr:peptidase M50 [Candidatus Halobonum tyrrellensis]ESP88708.1 peptidase M50 [Candidatus Halobonum tyrrellensis G22]